MTTSAYRRNLFDTLDHWVSNPTGSFNLWLGEQQFKSTTANVYRSMFARFASGLKMRVKQLIAAKVPIYPASLTIQTAIFRQPAKRHSPAVSDSNTFGYLNVSFLICRILAYT